MNDFWTHLFSPPPAKSSQASSSKKNGGKALIRREGSLPSDLVSASIKKLEQLPSGDKIPNASLIYGIGAAIIFAYSLVFLISGPRITGLLLWLPASALLGFALHFMKYDGR